jgi:multiple sugar transport system ATP-binding protein
MDGVSIDGVSKAFGQTRVLDDVSLDIAPGEFLTLVGPSGCGKTTLLRIIAGLESQDRGTIYIGDRPVDDLAPKTRDIAMVFQSYALYPYMTVAENIALPLTMRRLNAAQRLPLLGRFIGGASAARQSIDADVEAVAAALGIAPLLARKPAQLSGGQRQRVALARAMVRRPSVFLMDEPLSNLDAKMRVKARTEIADLHRQVKTTFIYVTHDQAEAMTMSDRVAVMMDGRLLQVAAPQTIYDDPAHVKVAGFIGTPEINLFPAVARGDGAVDVFGAVWPFASSLPAGTRLSIGVRPESLVLEPLSTRAGLTGFVTRLERLGCETLVHVGLDNLASTIVVRLDAHDASCPAPGMIVSVTPKPDRVLAFDGEGRRVAAKGVAQNVRSTRRDAVHV